MASALSPVGFHRHLFEQRFQHRKYGFLERGVMVTTTDASFVWMLYTYAPTRCPSGTQPHHHVASRWTRVVPITDTRTIAHHLTTLRQNVYACAQRECDQLRGIATMDDDQMADDAPDGHDLAGYHHDPLLDDDELMELAAMEPGVPPTTHAGRDPMGDDEDDDDELEALLRMPVAPVETGQDAVGQVQAVEDDELEALAAAVERARQGDVGGGGLALDTAAGAAAVAATDRDGDGAETPGGGSGGQVHTASYVQGDDQGAACNKQGDVADDDDMDELMAHAEEEDAGVEVEEGADVEDAPTDVQHEVDELDELLDLEAS